MFSLFLLPLPLFFHVAGALLNVSIDDTDPSIMYGGQWEGSSTIRSSLDYGGGHAVSTDSSASATLTFTGVAVYYVVPRWPYAVNTQLSLDGGQAVVVNLTDPNASTTSDGGSESAQYSVAWSATGLSNTTHKLVLTMAPGGQFIVADGFIYTVNNGSSPSSSASLPSGTSSAGSAASSGGSTVVPGKSDTLAIGIGVALGAAALIAAAAVAFFIWKRRRPRRAQPVSNVLDEWGQDAYPPAPVTPFLVGAASAPQRRPTHVPSMSDASTGPLLATPWDRDQPTSQYRPTSEYRDDPRSQTMSVSDHSYGTASGSGSSSSRQQLPPGAGAADPMSVYDDEGSELASGSGSIARTASSVGYLGPSSRPRRNEKAVPPREEVYTPAPPAYSES
ncbi:hypothetical protein MVEN_01719300 [Mycena venus]|uniref:Uncharacterized protein n=1 Tax=Mycena venus TaxID=2733690 RepID=A0A8H6XPB3_9AGAR|nr:hypothetical protein MVEN_01719300 [Mycena venus]